MALPSVIYIVIFVVLVWLVGSGFNVLCGTTQIRFVIIISTGYSLVNSHKSDLSLVVSTRYSLVNSNRSKYD